MNDGSLYDLPEFWAWVRLGEIAEVITGNTPSKKDLENYGDFIPFVKPPELNDCVVSAASDNLSEKGAKLARILPVDSVLVSCIGNLGKIGLNKIPVAFNQQINSIIFPKNEIIPKYGFYYFQTLKIKKWLNAIASATTISIVNKSKFVTIPLPLPPLPEQRTIISKLEQLFSDLDNGIDNFKKAQAQLKLYRQSILKNACEGKLVPTEAELARREGRGYEAGDVLLARILKERREKWEDDQIVKFKNKGKIPTDSKWKTKFKAPISPNIENLSNLPEGWTWTSPDQISSWDDPYSFAIGPFGSNLKVSDYMSQGVPLVFVRNIRSGIFMDDKTKYVSDVKAKELRPHWISSGDILITKMGDPPGDSYLYPDGLPNAIITADCIKLRLCNLSSNQYLLNAIKSQIVRSQINSITKGVAQKKVSLARIKTIGLPLPPLAEQHRIVAEVERRLSVCDKMETIIKESFQKAESLRQSILKKAFEGKLLNEKELEEARAAPDWEPAGKLLERIKAEKINTQTKKKGKK